MPLPHCLVSIRERQESVTKREFTVCRPSFLRCVPGTSRTFSIASVPDHDVHWAIALGFEIVHWLRSLVHVNVAVQYDINLCIQESFLHRPAHSIAFLHAMASTWVRHTRG